MSEHSVMEIATEMHNYFRDLQSYYTLAKGSLISQMESVSDDRQLKSLENQLHEIEEKLLYFHVLNNSISTVDTVLHTSKMIKEFKDH